MTIKSTDGRTFNLALRITADCDASLVEYCVTFWNKMDISLEMKVFHDGEFPQAIAYYKQMEAKGLAMEGQA